LIKAPFDVVEYGRKLLFANGVGFNSFADVSQANRRGLDKPRKVQAWVAHRRLAWRTGHGVGVAIVGISSMVPALVT